MIHSPLLSPFSLCLIFAINVHAQDVSPYIAKIRANLVTSDVAGSHLALPGVPVAYPAYFSGSLDTGGVGRVFVNAGPSGFFSCSGALLSTGRHILTAAHCLSDASGNVVAESVRVNFPLDVGTVSVVSTEFATHPLFDGQVAHGYDIAVITLPAEVPGLVPRYDLFRGEVAPDTVALRVGYGRSGIGSTGDTQSSGRKRTGLNLWEAGGLDFINGIENGFTQLTYDFDSGRTPNDAFHAFFKGRPKRGLGDDEVAAAPGDSGGPSFVEVGGEFLIAGVTTYGFHLELFNGWTSDVDDIPNSSWGEFSVDTNVSVLAPWIEGQVNPEAVPAPSPSPLSTAIITVFFANLRQTLP